jgi:hypothetical protein
MHRICFPQLLLQHRNTIEVDGKDDYPAPPAYKCKANL